jgi:hypothetical protein
MKVRKEYMKNSEENYIIAQEDAPKVSWIKRWYSFNKQNIPAILLLISLVFITAFLDFTIQGTPIKLESHFNAITKLGPDTPAAIYIFFLYLIACIQMFNGFSFGKKRNPFGLILINILTLASVIILVSYILIFVNEVKNVESFKFIKSTYISITVFSIGVFFMVLAAIYSFFVVDYNYVREKDE